MAVAKLYPEGQQGKKGTSIKNMEAVSSQYVTHARTVLKWLPELADRVLAGTSSLNEAYADFAARQEWTTSALEK